MPQVSIPAVIMRGGSSKGVFLHRDLLPEAGPGRDALILGLLGSPDPMQIDGLGGTHSSTSKVVGVRPSARPDADIDYLFAQGAITQAVVDYNANCGNLTAAAGTYAVDEGMVAVTEPVTVVRMYNENTGKIIIAHVPVEDGKAAASGSCRIAGVPGTSARILTEYLDPAGSVYDGLLPTGRAIDRLEVDGRVIEVSIVDATIAIVFVRPADVGLTGDELPEQVNRNPAQLALLERIRGAACVLLGAVERAEDAATLSMAVPKLAWVLPPRDTILAGGGKVAADEMDLLARMVSVGKVHHALPLTGLMCAAAACFIPGTIPSEAYRAGSSADVRVCHPKGIVTATVDGGEGEAGIRSVTVERTARRLMAGEVYLQGAAAAAVTARRGRVAAPELV